MTTPNRIRHVKTSATITPPAARQQQASPKHGWGAGVPKFTLRDKSTGKSISEIPRKHDNEHADFFNRIERQPPKPAYVPTMDSPFPPHRVPLLKMTRSSILWEIDEVMNTPLVIPPQPPTIESLGDPTDEQIRASRPQHNPWNESNIKLANERVSSMLNVRHNEVVWSASDVTFKNAELICFPMMGNMGQAMGFIYATPQSIAKEVGKPFIATHSDFAPNQNNPLQSNPIDEQERINPHFRWAFVRQLVTARMASSSSHYQIMTITKPEGRYTPGLLELCAQQASDHLRQPCGLNFNPVEHELRDLQANEQLFQNDAPMARIFQTILPVPVYSDYARSQAKHGYHTSDILSVDIFCPHLLSPSFEHVVYLLSNKITAEHTLFLIARNSDANKDDMTLIAEGKKLDNEVILEDAGIENGAQLFVIFNTE